MVEENKHNPTIREVSKVNCTNHFVIKYKTEDQRIRFSNALIYLVQRHELKDFHIEEKEAYEKVRIIYNGHTLLTMDEFSFDEVEKRFLNYYEN